MRYLSTLSYIYVDGLIDERLGPLMSNTDDTAPAGPVGRRDRGISHAV